MPLGDIFDQATLTNLIVKSRAMDNTVPGQSAVTGLGASIAPLVDTRTNAVKMRVIEDSTMGLGQFRAPEASYPLVARNLTAYETMIEIVQLAEKIRVNEIQKMYSVDPNIRADALENFITDGQWLLNRNALLTNYMRWKGLEQGYFDITYPTGGTIRVDYGYDGTHLVTPGGTDWDDPTATVIDDILAWNQLLTDDAGVTDYMYHMSTKTWRMLFLNDEIKAALGTDGRAYVFPTQQDVVALTGLSNVVLYDEVYRDDTGTVNRFWPENKILITAGGNGYSVGGMRIAEMLNGVVPVSTRGNSVQFLTGPQTETYLDIESNTEFLRLASARMLRINAPEAIIVATVWS
jgi:hypothetical protein